MDIFSKWHKITIMTTRAGAAGLGTGLIITFFIYSLFYFGMDESFNILSSGVGLNFWIAIVIPMILITAGGFLAARWSRSVQTWRRVALGSLSGSLAGIVVFCLWGAAAVGLSARVSQSLVMDGVIKQTLYGFLILFLGGSGFGALGGGLAGVGRSSQTDVFGKGAPQMAMNASITAVLASIFASALTAYVFPLVLAANVFSKPVAALPLEVSLLFVLVSQLALTLVIPHEVRQSEHRNGMDEVKMAAFVDIATAPVLAILLVTINKISLHNPLVWAALLASLAMSLQSIYFLIKLVLPNRAAFPAPHEKGQKMETILFGTIAVSRGPRLVVLCIGCGLAMVLPLHVTVISILINIKKAAPGYPFSGGQWNIFPSQASVFIGEVAASILLLTIIYLAYLNLGRWYSRWISIHAK